MVVNVNGQSLMVKSFRDTAFRVVVTYPLLPIFIGTGCLL